MLNQRNQSGFALLIFMLVIISIYFLAASELLTKTVQQRNQQKRLKNIEILNLAKEALIDYSVDYIINNTAATSHIARLPCPDVKNVGAGFADIEGIQDANCGNQGVNSVGYFPYKTLGLGIIRDSSKECLWYAVSGNYKNNPPSPIMINWDTVASNNGFLRLVDENKNQLHGSNLNDYPIALIISPGDKVSNQSRDADTDMPSCNSNYTFTNYLEGGPNIDYPDDVDASDEKNFPKLLDTVWDILSVSASSKQESVEYNDTVVAIYKHEIWDKIAEIETTKSNSSSHLQKLTKDLTTCLKTYMETESNFNNAIYPASLNLTNYADSTLYKSVASNRYGRFPEDITNSDTLKFHAGVNPSSPESSSTVNKDNFITAYCNNVAGVSLDIDLWENWKDHFFLVVADDFLPINEEVIANKCTDVGDCITINLKTATAVIFFAGEATKGQKRQFTVISTDQEIWNQYLNDSDLIDENEASDIDDANQILYVDSFVDSNTVYNLVVNDTDYAYCVVKTGSTLSAEEC